MLFKSKSRHGSRGFSLTELLIAMLFVGFLMAGMLQVFAAGLKGFRQADATLGAQRTMRWAVALLEEDLQSLGFFFPLRPVPGNINLGTGQNPLMLLPGQTVEVKVRSSSGLTPVTETLVTDEIQYLTDQPLRLTARLQSDATTVDQAVIEVLTGTLSDVQAGDFMAVLDPAFEVVRIKTVDSASGKVTLDTDASVQQDAAGNPSGVSPGFAAGNHKQGAQVLFVRPMQVVRYSIQPFAVDPANPQLQIPCLTRQQAPYPITGTLIDWSGVAATRVAEHVTRLRFDMSLDGGRTWARAGAANWDAVRGNLDDQLTALNVKDPFPISLTNTATPLWYRNVPMLIRADITSRTAVRLDLSAERGTPQYGFRERTQSLLISPRNASLAL